MSAIRTVLAVIVLFPLAAAAGIDAAPGAGQSVLPEVAGPATGAPQTPGTNCCWIWYYGSWVCVPC